MPTFELRNKRAKLIAAEVSASDLATACEIAAERIGFSLRELLDRIPADYEMVELPEPGRRASLPRKRLFRDRARETVH